ncbi:MAG: ORF6N domain-containing protein [Bacteroides heparinolyticus]|nr:ORF6N domain-containing protein [Bacteroides heparinolyticus]
MKTLPTVNTLQPILHNQIPVITTELLAQLYCTEINNIKVNYTRNAERFVEGKHFFKVAGDELKNLRVTLSNSQNTISPKTRTLILWTERGAARHAKMLETNQAWDVFERLEDSYFNQNAQTAATVTVSPNNAREVVDTLNAKPMF